MSRRIPRPWYWNHHEPGVMHQIPRNCILCGEMICGCPTCEKSPSVQGIIGICDTDFWAVFGKLRSREDPGNAQTVSATDPRVVYLFNLKAELSTERQLAFAL